MRNELAFDEIRKEIKKIQRRSNNKTILFIILGMVIVGLAAILIIMKVKDKLSTDSLDYDEDDEEYVYYESDDDDEYYEDYRALDYEEEEE